MANIDTQAEGVPGRYASALFELAKDSGAQDAVEVDLVKFQTLMQQSPDLTNLVRSPTFSSEQQGKALGAVLAKMGIGGLAANFLQLLARNRRLFAVDQMTQAYRSIAAKHRGEVVAEVTSAHALTPEQMTQLSDTLRTSVGKSVRIDAKVDPNLLGGLVVKIGSRMIDSSLRTKLNALKVAMKGTG